VTLKVKGYDMAQVIVLHAADGHDVVRQIRALLQAPGRPAQTLTFDRPRPHLWDQVVFLYVLSPGSLADRDLLRYAHEIAAEGFPLVPVVPQLSGYAFASIPTDLEVIRSRNAVGVAPEDAPRFLESVDGYLGMESFLENREVFISYRRSDSEQAARAIEAYLWTQRCVPFLDTLQIPGGQVVQEKVMAALHQKDFVLFLDSPDAGNSDWVRAEVLEAFLQRIPVRVVRMTPGQMNIDLLRDRQFVDWNPANPHNLETIMRLISRGIASRVSLDDRVSRTLADLAHLYDIRLERPPGGPRRFRLVRGGKTLLLEYEDSGVSLERLHRLFLWFSDPPPSTGALFVCGDFELFPLTRAAVSWACHTNPIKVMPLGEIATELQQWLQ
jgi:hypothetical protein